MKKLVGILAGLICVMLLLFCGCGPVDDGTSDTVKIPERPKDTNLEFWIVDDVADFDWSGYELTGSWNGISRYYGKNYSKADEEGYYVKYTVSAWPDLADEGQFITDIEITDPEIIVYGLTVNSSFDEFEKVFKEKNFEIKRYDRAASKARISASNGTVWFKLQMEHSSGKMMFSINVEVSNREVILF